MLIASSSAPALIVVAAATFWTLTVSLPCARVDGSVTAPVDATLTVSLPSPVAIVVAPYRPGE